MLMVGAFQSTLRTHRGIPEQHWMDEKGVAAGWMASKDFLKSHTAVRCLDVFAAKGKLNSLARAGVLLLFSLLLFYLSSLQGGTSGCPRVKLVLWKERQVWKKINSSLIAIALRCLNLSTRSSSLFLPLHTVPPSNHPLNKPMRKQQRKCVRDQFLSVSQLRGWAMPLLTAAVCQNEQE